jgi:hypothetical protein
VVVAGSWLPKGGEWPYCAAEMVSWSTRPGHSLDGNSTLVFSTGLKRQHLLQLGPSIRPPDAEPGEPLPSPRSRSLPGMELLRKSFADVDDLARTIGVEPSHLSAFWGWR